MENSGSDWNKTFPCLRVQGIKIQSGSEQRGFCNLCKNHYNLIVGSSPVSSLAEESVSLIVTRSVRKPHQILKRKGKEENQQ